MGQTPSKVTGIAIVWANTLLYGIYASLFFETMYIVIHKKRTRTLQAKIFFWSSIVMFILATAHLAINFYRLLRSYAFIPDHESPTAYFFELYSWDNIAHGAIEVAVTWMGDCLVIYRCYIVWDRNWKVVILPISLLLTSIIAYGISVYRSLHLPGGTIFDGYLVSWVSTLYATFVVQNVLTTGLLAYRIYTQHHRSRVSTSGSGSAFKRAKVGPMCILRIIVESAAIYAIQALLLNIMYATGNNAQYILEAGMQVPVIGIVFTLMMVRLAMTRSEALLPTTYQAKNGDSNIVVVRSAVDVDPATTGRDLSFVASGLGYDGEAASGDAEAARSDLREKGILGLGSSTSAHLEHSNESSVILHDMDDERVR